MICLIAVLAIFGSQTHPRHTPLMTETIEVCEELIERNHPFDLDPVLVIAVASEESRLRRDVESQSGAIGVMQILPIYWCPVEGSCNAMEAGLTALQYYMNKYDGDVKKALTGYAGAGKRARAYARRVMSRMRHINSVLEAI